MNVEAQERTPYNLIQSNITQLLTHEEESRLSKIIQDSYHEILRTIKDSNHEEIKHLQSQINNWEQQDPSLKPKKKHLVIINHEIGSAVKENPQDSELINLQKFIGNNSESIDTACNKLTTSNLRLVHYVSKKYSNRGLPIDDIIQEGCLGLIRAVYRFNYSKGNRFSSYAIWWIKQSITRAIIDKTKMIRLPTHISEHKSKLSKTFRRMVNQLGREPTLEEMSKETGIPLKKLMLILKVPKSTVSLSAPVGDNDTLKDFIVNERADNPAEIVESRALLDKIINVLSTLSEREALVIRLRFGFGYPKHTLEEVSNIFQVSKERVRQIEMIALHRLKHPQRREELKGYLNSFKH